MNMSWASPIKVVNALSVNLAVLRFFGQWPPEKSEINRKWYYAYKVYSICSVGFWFILYVITEFINIAMVWGDIEKTVEASFLLMTHTSQLIKVVLVFSSFERVRYLVKQLDSPLFNQGKSEHVRILSKCMTRVKLETVLFLSCAAGTIILWGIFPFVEGKERQLPLKAWYPFDALKSPMYEIVFVYQLVAVTIVAFANISMDCLGSNIMGLTGAQIDILNYEVTTLWRPPSEDKNSSYMTNKLNDIIEHHLEIIKYVADQEYAFSFMYLGQFIVAVLVICITAFQISIVPISIKFFSMILYLICMLVEIFLYCMHGNEIMVKNEEVTNSIMQSGWYEEDAKFIRKMIIFMLRVQRPLQVTTGKLFTLSLTTYVGILKSSYSYFALLRTMHDK